MFTLSLAYVHHHLTSYYLHWREKTKDYLFYGGGDHSTFAVVDYKDYDYYFFYLTEKDYLKPVKHPGAIIPPKQNEGVLARACENRITNPNVKPAGYHEFKYNFNNSPNTTPSTLFQHCIDAITRPIEPITLSLEYLNHHLTHDLSLKLKEKTGDNLFYADRFNNLLAVVNTEHYYFFYRSLPFTVEAIKDPSKFNAASNIRLKAYSVRERVSDYREPPVNYHFINTIEDKAPNPLFKECLTIINQE